MKLDNWALTEFNVHPLAFGAMRFLSNKDNPKDPERIHRAESLIELALDFGINLFDHADLYGGGNCESIFGEVLKRHPQWRERMIIQTKAGIQGFPIHRYNSTANHLKDSIDKSLSRLGVEHIDVFLIHRPDSLMNVEEIARAFSEVKQAGKVKYFGVSNFSVSQMQLLQSYCDFPLIANQVQLSLVHPWLLSEGVFVNRTEIQFTGGEGILAHCQMNSIQVQAWASVAEGILSKGVDEISDNRVLAIKRVMDLIVAETGMSAEAIALAWLRKHPSRIVPICGTMSEDRLKQLVLGMEWEMPDTDWWGLFNAALGRRLP